jgi:hypothetical protein
MGSRVVPAGGHPLCCFVPRSVCLSTLSFGKPTAIMGPILDMVAFSRAVIVGAIGEELGW